MCTEGGAGLRQQQGRFSTSSQKGRQSLWRQREILTALVFTVKQEAGLSGENEVGERALEVWRQTQYETLGRKVGWGMVQRMWQDCLQALKAPGGYGFTVQLGSVVECLLVKLSCGVWAER